MVRRGPFSSSRACPASPTARKNVQRPVCRQSARPMALLARTARVVIGSPATTTSPPSRSTDLTAAPAAAASAKMAGRRFERVSCAEVWSCRLVAWRRAMVGGLLSLDPAPARVLDVATGTADVAPAPPLWSWPPSGHHRPVTSRLVDSTRSTLLCSIPSGCAQWSCLLRQQRSSLFVIGVHHLGYREYRSKAPPRSPGSRCGSAGPPPPSAHPRSAASAGAAARCRYSGAASSPRNTSSSGPRPGRPGRSPPQPALCLDVPSTDPRRTRARRRRRPGLLAKRALAGRAVRDRSIPAWRLGSRGQAARQISNINTSRP
jgi:hypothetical protein